MNKFSALFLLTICVMASGCALTPEAAKEPFQWPWSKNKGPKPYPNPVKMAVTWTPDVLIQSGCTPTRGFGGRVYFYNERSKAVPVAGELSVHGFEDNTSSDGMKQGEGVKRFRFTSEQFTRHFSETDLGASYSIWIPWDASGGMQKKLTLIPTFKTAEGKIVQGDAAIVVLPGKKAEGVANTPSSLPAVRQVGHFVDAGQSTASQGLNQSSKMQTTTIPLPRTFQQRLARMPEQSTRTVPTNNTPWPYPTPPPTSAETKASDNNHSSNTNMPSSMQNLSSSMNNSSSSMQNLGPISR